MKKVVFSLFISILSLSAFAQKDVTTFLGIPIDGYKSEMIRKLKSKGFTPSVYDKDVLTGEFNGHDVNLHVVTNNNKVYRIMVVDKVPQNESSIKIRFNRLCSQFENNSRYISLIDQTIPESEDISYEMSVNNKRYEAVFYQKSELKPVWFMISDYSGEYCIVMYYDNVLNQANGEDL